MRANDDAFAANDVPTEISNLYRRVKTSHISFHLGLDAEGQEIAKKKKFSFCRSERVRSRMNSTSSDGPRALRRSPTLQSYKARDSRFSRAYSKMVQHPYYKAFSMMFAVGALYTKDLCYAVVPKTADFFVMNVLLSVIFFWLFLELILYSATHRNYCFTFFFWLDLVGTSSVLIDIPWILIGIGLQKNIFLIVKGGRMGRAARGAKSMRFMKLIKMVRMIKLFRIINFFRKNKKSEAEEAGHDEFFGDEQVKPSKMGQLLADRVTQKVILGVLVSILLMPLFDVAPVDGGEKTFLGLEDLENLYTKNHDPLTGELPAAIQEMYEDSRQRFMAYNDDIMMLRVASALENGEDFCRIEIEDAGDDGLRVEEKAEYITESGRSSAILNVRSSVMEEAVLNIALTTFMMFIFGLGSFIISAETFIMVHPLEYLVIVLRRLSVIAVHAFQKQSAEEEVDGEELFSSVMQSMTDIFYSGKRETMFIDLLEKKVDKIEIVRPSLCVEE